MKTTSFPSVLSTAKAVPQMEPSGFVRSQEQNGWRSLLTATLLFFGVGAPAFAVTTDVALPDAAEYAQAAAEYVHGKVTQVAVSKYLDVDDSVIAYAVEFTQNASKQPVTVIASATHLQAPVQMVYSGLPYELDQARVAAASKTVAAKTGLDVGAPEKVYWAGPYAFYFSYHKGSVLFQPSTQEFTTLADLKAALTDTATGAAVPATLAPKFGSETKQLYIADQWNAAAAHLKAKTTGGPPANGTPQHGYTKYIANVPYLNQTQTPDCGVVSMMDILLYWQGKGYPALINPSTLSADRTMLQQAFGWTTNGTYADQVAAGTNNVIKQHYNGAQVQWFARENYSSSHYSLYSTNMAFSSFTSEIDVGRPAQLCVFGYTQSNTTDHNYGNHAVCGVGYANGEIFTGSKTQWAIIHDNWQGDPNFVNAYLNEPEPYMDWSQVDEMLKVIMSNATTVVTTPRIQSPTPGSTLTSTAATFTWNAGTNVTQYWLYVGTSAGASNIFNSNSLTSSTLSKSVTTLPLTGQTLYVRLFWMINNGWNSADYTYTAARPVYTKAALVTPAAGSALSSTTQTFAWNTGTSATAYWLYVGTSSGSSNLYNSNSLPTSVLSKTVSTLPSNGSTVYVRLWTQLNGAWQYTDYTFTAYKNLKAQMISPAPNSRFTSTSVTFNWSAGSGATNYWLYVGSTLGGSEYYNSNSLSSSVLSRSVTNLPSTGRQLYVRLWTYVNGGWQYNDYSYTSK